MWEGVTVVRKFDSPKEVFNWWRGVPIVRKCDSHQGV